MSERITVTEIKLDGDPFGGEYVQVCFGYTIPTPRPKNLPPNAVFSAPPFWKHAVHLIIPKEQWMGQYTLYQECMMEMKANGEFTLKGVNA